jgi:hypothetical protein
LFSGYEYLKKRKITFYKFYHHHVSYICVSVCVRGFFS